MRTNRLITACWLAAVFLCGGVGAHAQTKSEPGALVPAVERDHKAEQQLTVALLEEIHKQGGMVPKLITPTDFAVQMTCSAAVDEDREADAQAHGITITQADVADVSLLLDSLAKSGACHARINRKSGSSFSERLTMKAFGHSDCRILDG